MTPIPVWDVFLITANEVTTILVRGVFIIIVREIMPILVWNIFPKNGTIITLLNRMFLSSQSGTVLSEIVLLIIN